MVQPYVGEIRLFAGNYAPLNWAICNGQQIAISANEVLYQLIGTTYGGNGTTYFNLPDLRGRLPRHQGTLQAGPAYVMGQMAGFEQVTLTVPQLPAHSHALNATNTGPTQNVATNAIPAVAQVPTNSFNVNAYGTGNTPTTLGPNSILAAGQSLAHENRQPFLCINFIIALAGIYPTQ